MGGSTSKDDGERGRPDCPPDESVDPGAAARWKAALAVEHPESAPAAYRNLADGLSNRLALRTVPVRQLSSKRKPLKRIAAATRLDFIVCSTEGKVRRAVQYQSVQEVMARQLAPDQVELYFRAAPPEHDILFRLRGGGAAGDTRALLACASRAREAVCGTPLEIRWVDPSTDLPSLAKLKKLPDWKRPLKHERVLPNYSLSLSECARLSGVVAEAGWQPPSEQPARRRSSAAPAPAPPAVPTDFVAQSGGAAPAASPDGTQPGPPSPPPALDSASPSSPPALPASPSPPGDSPSAAASGLRDPPASPAGSARERVQNALRADFPVPPEAAAVPAAGESAGPQAGAVCCVVCDKTNHQGKVQRRLVIATRLNLCLGTEKGDMRRLIRYKDLVSATARPVGGPAGQRGCEVLLQCAPPEHDILFRVDAANQSWTAPSEGGEDADLAHARALLACISLARELVAGAPMPVKWLQEGEGGSLAASAGLRKRPGWRSPGKAISAAHRAGPQDLLVELSGINIPIPDVQVEHPAAAPAGKAPQQPPAQQQQQQQPQQQREESEEAQQQQPPEQPRLSLDPPPKPPEPRPQHAQCGQLECEPPRQPQPQPEGERRSVVQEHQSAERASEGAEQQAGAQRSEEAELRALPEESSPVSSPQGPPPPPFGPTISAVSLRQTLWPGTQAGAERWAAARRAVLNMLSGGDAAGARELLLGLELCSPVGHSAPGWSSSPQRQRPEHLLWGMGGLSPACPPGGGCALDRPSPAPEPRCPWRSPASPAPGSALGGGTLLRLLAAQAATAPNGAPQVSALPRPQLRSPSVSAASSALL
eukprot:TRINITY_DN16986_c0_g1_i1.p1 TRINITY_DN16986_c0_g1~~TRINITY_DN16986_c0_g1_i1.p1  ORF type:complete len:847 (+),score=204.57 TRINITY_DN16986_c0_g1_i1:73-2541(+)